MMATQNDNDLVPDSCRVAAVDAIWKTIGEINGCHVDHAEWHTRDDAPYNDDDVCFLREQVWRRDQLLVVRYRGWSPSMHRSHHEAELDLPATSDPEDFVRELLVQIKERLERQRDAADLAKRVDLALPLDHRHTGHLLVDILHLIAPYLEGCLQNEIKEIEATIHAIVATCTEVDRSDDEAMMGDDSDIVGPTPGRSQDHGLFPVFRPRLQIAASDPADDVVVHGSMIIIANVQLPETVAIAASGRPLTVITKDLSILGPRVIESIQQGFDADDRAQLSINLVPDLWLVEGIRDLDEEMLLEHYPWIADLKPNCATTAEKDKNQ